MFSALGGFAYRARIWLLAATALFLVFAVGWGGGLFGAVSDGGFRDPDAESSRATELIEEELGHDAVDVIAVYRSSEITVDNPTFATAVQRTVDRLPESATASVTSYLDEGLSERERGALVSKDQHATYVAITLAGDSREERMANFEEIQADLDAGPLDTSLAGAIPMEHELSARAESDVVRAEMISLPILLVLLVAIFGGVVAALMPLAVGGLAILGSLVLLRALTYVTEVSVFAVNVATILGLGLAIDYGLFMVNRFREELARGGDARSALPTTLATAGRTVAFSGVTVLIAFGGLLFFPQPMLRSIGLGGIAVVLFDLVAALVVLPALLAVIGHRIDALRLPWPRRARPAGASERTGPWARLAHNVMRRPIRYVLVVGVLLLVSASALLSSRLGMTDHRYLPEEAGSRTAMEALRDDFYGGGTGTLDVAVAGAVADEDMSDYVRRLEALDGASGAALLRAEGDVAHLAVNYEGEADDAATADLVRDVRAEAGPDGAREVLVGGAAAEQLDSVAGIVDAVPWTLVFIVTVTLVLLFLAFGSLVLPVKAVLMGFLSLGASLGVVIWGFQEGHLGGLLGFDAVGTIDPTYLVLILIVAFGLAMDYELFLLSRVREEYLATGDNAHSVAVGLQRTGGIITSAALLLVVVLAAMGSSELLFLKIIGVGLAVAVAVDATLVRALLVPATMRLLGRANWWLPRPLRRLHDRVGITESEEVPAAGRVPDDRLTPVR
ncbi:MMPL family transporter [Marinitenerispora sediminis]|uniref:MMPL family transporter n=1 Tax=Marinitenerispora sediminis TaxID=1931232 RepID=A0A368T7V6_9ACTN|nr:MMPL family transporter [Marinitenerispora sediminis]RCV52461.1 MMPL family transporter [Marinitenerispora sediminis]RCV60224.1 MMPL family transporter [Marinitenerispora sediminis]RCV62206.1 MMPL family transporter [Marinitenerispora sediminis]